MNKLILLKKDDIMNFWCWIADFKSWLLYVIIWSWRMERDRLKSQKGIELYKIEKSDTEKEASLTTNLALIVIDLPFRSCIHR